jgi:hypothetical protein
MSEGGLSVRSLSWKDTTLINICDADLIGRTLSEGKLQMNISRDYFGGKIVDSSEALQLMKSSSIINLAGKRSVEIALANKMAAEQAVRLIGGVPFLMIYKFSY